MQQQLPTAKDHNVKNHFHTILTYEISQGAQPPLAIFINVNTAVQPHSTALNHEL